MFSFNVCENVVWKMEAILSLPQCVKSSAGGSCCSQQQPPWEAKKFIVDIEKSIQIIYQNIGQIGFILTILIIYVNTRCKIILSPQ